jgi:hypothetical protein
MSDDHVFRECLICELIRPELNQKVSILGLFGLASQTEIKVNDPDGQISDLSFLFISHRLTELMTYHVGLSIKDPSGFLMFPMMEQDVNLTRAEIINLAYAFRPFRLNGAGKYQIYVMVNEKVDFEASFLVLEAKPGELVP